VKSAKLAHGRMSMRKKIDHNVSAPMILERIDDYVLDSSSA
jgi:hypothetical protein